METWNEFSGEPERLQPRRMNHAIDASENHCSSELVIAIRGPHAIRLILILRIRAGMVTVSQACILPSAITSDFILLSSESGTSLYAHQPLNINLACAHSLLKNMVTHSVLRQTVVLNPSSETGLTNSQLAISNTLAPQDYTTSTSELSMCFSKIPAPRS